MMSETNLLPCFEVNGSVLFSVGARRGFGWFIGWEKEGVRHGASSITAPGTWPPLSPQPASFTLLQQQVLFIHPTLPLPPKTSSALFPDPIGRGWEFICLAKKKKRHYPHLSACLY